ncbi:hypothetical protein PHMEG_00023211 [Phytophthora megakarya]|uniref:Uncharacterized protein n=1 Tax=Phytophthora megakarya TaxID=4795 RepID=A0A225VGR9_9STRA|nr:hypothetical protein PHMEG_00023211 [Phytophthora megakarya]
MQVSLQTGIELQANIRQIIHLSRAVIFRLLCVMWTAQTNTITPRLILEVQCDLAYAVTKRNFPMFFLSLLMVHVRSH